ncbi:MAG: hypothetical protein AB7K52_03575 [Phycisphaerales bacterium]
MMIHDDITLAIEAANPSMPEASVALGFGDEVRAFEPIAPATREADHLVAAVARACASSGVAPGRINRVAVSVGPGGYTAVRMAVAAGKLIAEAAWSRRPSSHGASRAACVAVPSALSVAHAVRSLLPPGPFAVVLACKGETGYVAEFAPDLSPGPVRVRRAREIETLNPRPVALVLDPAVGGAFAPAAAGIGALVVPARCDARSCLAAARGLPIVDPLELLPIYAREPEAVSLWRARRAPGPPGAP